MANFSSKKTGMNVTSWEYYIQDKDDWKKFEKNIKVEFTGNNPPILFKDPKGKQVIGKPLKNGEALQLLNNKSYMIEEKIHGYVKSNTSGSGYLKISAIGKPTKDTTKDENIALDQLSTAIKNRKGNGSGICIIIKNKKNEVKYSFMDCAGVKTITGTPKADFAIHNSSNKMLCYISHKKEGGAKAYQQYVSVTGNGDDGINDHPFLKRFLKNVAGRIDEIVKNKTRYKTYIPFASSDGNPKLLIQKAIFGPDYGGAFSKDHVHLIGQGTPTLKEAKSVDRPKGRGTTYELTFSDDVSISGDLSHFKDNGYRPIILARYSSDRKFYVEGETYTGARILIGPDQLASGSAREI